MPGVLKFEAPLDVNAVDSRVFQTHYLEGSKPIFISGLPLSMPCYEKWTYSYFAALAGDVQIDISDDPFKRGRADRKATMATCMDWIENDPACPYLIGWPFEDAFPSLGQDFQLPAFHPADFIEELRPRLRFRRKWIFFGKAGLCSDLHVDAFTTNAWFLVTRGVKEVRCLSPLHRDKVTFQDSLFDDATVARLCEQGVDIYSFAAEPGTILYMPSGWLHYVRNQTNTIMATGNFSTFSDVVRFYSNFRETIGSELVACDGIYQRYITDVLQRATPSPETRLALRYEEKRLNAEIAERRRLLDVIVGTLGEAGT
jgi:hypothetical protein